MHDIDITDGQASFVSARQDPWHRLGITLDSTFTAEEAMQYGRLGGWNVRKVPTFAEENGVRLETPGRYAVVRTNPVNKKPEVIGNVGEAYTVIQNEQHADLLNALVDEGGAHFETAGALNGGSKVFITMKLPTHMKVGGVDPFDMYLAAVNTHDGSAAFMMMVTPIRIVCQNTLNFAIGRARNTFKVRHTTGSDRALIQQAREILELTWEYEENFQDLAERLINATMTQRQFEEMVTREFGVPDDAPAATITRTENKIEEMFRLYADEYTQEGVRDTAWAAVNALTEWYDHFSPVRSTEPELTRAQKAISVPWFKNRVMEMVRNEVGV